ncbi:xanthine phosphoribosyltransferase [Leuconostoc carnosum]|uniref:Xanthine phosphoribosyltransferase n=2 Tax=Leuconostoc carnosum TaxID=1252 RepID=K0DC71_LEUCJ|nr:MULTISPECIES: xanthine phosphoribosyltransferase [Leuconostoc]AFT82460.1 xanthine phosphoribosyltransferase [Leuconostoc carnosum JB16]KAA8324567.1 xanthine phosphoribosyltransferase [Leuconostoc carnosum]KAA8327134.1 xanthine phosphoribosyltransferase [Leuconostoc carnosum]KAA8358240.1 xanthine phosphoribosyltransferase [Leuconostoc carnosum]KAA8364738.1 xanthine phosphoribosyltransferase [Leuconostoc carnosum]
MKLLEERIQQDGRILGDEILKVDAFLNHQIDPELMAAMGEEFSRLFANDKIDKILTVESSGIAPAVFAGLSLHVPVVFARKNKSLTLPTTVWAADVYSFTKQTTNQIMIDQQFLKSGEKVLIIDDFLANGQAVNGLLKIASQADAHVVGAGIVIEKTFQKGRQILDEQGIRVESLARVKAFVDGQVAFL